MLRKKQEIQYAKSHWLRFRICHLFVCSVESSGSKEKEVKKMKMEKQEKSKSEEKIRAAQTQEVKKSGSDTDKAATAK